MASPFAPHLSVPPSLLWFSVFFTSFFLLFFNKFHLCDDFGPLYGVCWYPFLVGFLVLVLCVFVVYRSRDMDLEVLSYIFVELVERLSRSRGVDMENQSFITNPNSTPKWIFDKVDVLKTFNYRILEQLIGGVNMS